MQFLGWGYACVGLLVAIAYIAIGATVVRKASPKSGYMLIAVGVLVLLMRCCTRALSFAELDGDAAQATFLLVGFVGIVQTIAIGALVAVAAVMLAKAAQPATAQPATAQPAPPPQYQPPSA